MGLSFMADTLFGWIFVVGMIVGGYLTFLYLQKKAEKRRG